jgi:hypothetical protein
MYTHLVAQVSLKVGHGNTPWKVMECSKDFCTAEHAYRFIKVLVWRSEQQKDGCS